MVWYLIVIYIYFNNNEITFAGHIYSVKMNIPLSCTDTWKFWNIL